MSKLLALFLFVTAAFAADATGKWMAQFEGPNGKFDLVFNFKQDGSKLTGNVIGPQGEPLEIVDGKVEGDTITFAVEMQDRKIMHEGKVSEKEIELKIKMPDGGDGGRTMKLKKQ